MLANQRRSWQLQRPLGRVPLATTYEDADLQHARQSQRCLHQDSLSGAQTATTSLLAATPSANARKIGWLTVTRLPTQGRQASSQSPSCGHRFPGLLTDVIPLLSFETQSNAGVLPKLKQHLMQVLSCPQIHTFETCTLSRHCACCNTYS